MTDYEKYCPSCNVKFVENDDRLIHSSYCPSCLVELKLVDTTSPDGTFKNPSNVDNIDEKMEDDDRSIINESVEKTAIMTVYYFSWIYLICSVIVSIYILFNYGTTEQVSFRRTETVYSPIGVGLAIGILLQGILGRALLIITASIAENLITIKNNSKPEEEKSSPRTSTSV